METHISDWIKKCVEGPGGLLDYEKYELAIRNDTDEIVAASWIIRCLANPHNEGSQEVLDEILKQREKVTNEPAYKPKRLDEPCPITNAQARIFCSCFECRDLYNGMSYQFVSLLDTEIKPVLQFNEVIEEDDDVGFEAGMMARAISYQDNGDGWTITVDFTDYETHNLTIESPVWSEPNCDVNKKWSETSFYPNDKICSFSIGYASSVPFDIVEQLHSKKY